MEGVDPRLISYSALAVVVIGGTWGIRRMIRGFSAKAESPKRPRKSWETQAGGDLGKAAKLASEAGDHDEAGRLFALAGRDLEAARSYRAAKAWDRAAELFETAKDFAAAAGCYKRMGNGPAQLRMLQAANDWPAAADLADQLGNHAVAAELFQRLGQPARAIPHLIALGKSGAVAKLQAAAHEAEGNFAGAAERWVAAGELDRALACSEKAGDAQGSAAILAKLGRREESAERYVALQDFGQAASLFEQLGAYRKAALNYQKSGNVDRAIHCLMMDGDKLTVIKLRMAAGQAEEALRVALSVGSAEPAYPEVAQIAADLLEQKGDAAGAGRTLALLLMSPVADALRLRLGERTLRLLVGAGELARARQVIDRLLPLLDDPTSSLAVYIGDMEDKLPRAADKHADRPASVAAERPGAAEKPAQPAGSSRKATAEAARPVGTTPTPVENTVDDFGEGGEGEWPSGVPQALSSRYGHLERLGQGGNGIVFSSTDKLLGRRVVLKFMLEGSMPSDMQRKYFQREVKLAAQLNHPNIVHIYDMGETDGILWYAMEFIDGKPLTGFMTYGQPLTDPKWTCGVLDQFAAALDCAHQHGLVHRDIKPDNLIVTHDGTVKLLDFGLARVRDEGFGELSVLAGTPYYMAPEQLDGSEVDHRADLYAFGVIVFRMLTGYLPFSEGNVFVAHAVEPVPDPRKFNSKLDARATALVNKAMAKKAADRFNSAKEIAEAVRALIA